MSLSGVRAVMMQRMGCGLRGLGAAAIVVAVLVSCTSASPESSATIEESGSPGASASVEPQPPLGIIFRLERLEGIGPLLPHLTLYTDGRLLRWEILQDQLTVRTLSPAGIDAFVAEVIDSGSFATSHAVPLNTLPGVEPPGIEVPIDRFTLAAGGGPPIEVTNVPFNDPRWFAASAERDALIALADRLMAPDWLSAEDWLEPAPSPYVPAAYLLFSGFIGFPPEDPICPQGTTGAGTCDRDVATVDWPVSLPPDGFGPPFQSADGTQSTVDHCVVVDLDFAASLAAAMRPGPDGDLTGRLFASTSVPWRERNGFYDMQLRALLPEETQTCLGKNLFPMIGP